MDLDSLGPIQGAQKSSTQKNNHYTDIDLEISKIHGCNVSQATNNFVYVILA